MVTYFLFMVPMILGHSIFGFVAGWRVGVYHWGRVGGTALSAGLGLSPAIAGLAAGMLLLDRFTKIIQSGH